MKLYATVQSERATKGQGGNKFIRMELTAENKEYFGTIEFSPDEIKGIYFLTYIDRAGESHTIDTMRIKGKRQKDEKGFGDTIYRIKHPL